MLVPRPPLSRGTRLSSQSLLIDFDVYCNNDQPSLANLDIGIYLEGRGCKKFWIFSFLWCPPPPSSNLPEPQTSKGWSAPPPPGSANAKLGSGHQLREWGGLHNRRGEANEVLPLQKTEIGGGGVVLAILKGGGHKQVLG